uniref:Putative caspase-1 n=1 Tax=Culex tarsalis TaxID=7177 RepID=A0A1Q3FLD2_CULTA
MNQLDRQRILRNSDQLIQNTNYAVLKNECYQRRMLSEGMISLIEDRYLDEATRHKKLFEKITKRGPTAFQTLLDICQINFPAAYKLLKGGPAAGLNQSQNLAVGQHETFNSTFHPNRRRAVSANYGESSSQLAIQQQKLERFSIGSRSISAEDEDAKNNNQEIETTDGKMRLVEYTEPVQEFYKVELTTRPQRSRLLEVYPMTSASRGIIFIVNIIRYKNNTHPTRNGAEVDRDNLVSLFRQLGFKVFYYEDLTNEDFQWLVKELKNSPHLSAECFAFYILAHGNHNKGWDKIYLHENSILYVHDILKLFNNENCPKLINRPKLFFFSICRGDKADFGQYRSDANTERDGMINRNKEPPTNMPTYADMYICFSTVPGFSAHRDTNHGSWLVESMCQVWTKHAHDTDVEQLMKLVGAEMARYRTENFGMQTLASEQFGFYKLLYLNPGYSVE